MTAICESCKAAQAMLMMQKVDSLSQAAELVCVNCAYATVSRAEIGSYVLQVIKGVRNG